jgi:hypothetical protein
MQRRGDNAPPRVNLLSRERAEWTEYGADGEREIAGVQERSRSPRLELGCGGQKQTVGAEDKWGGREDSGPVCCKAESPRNTAVDDEGRR